MEQIAKFIVELENILLGIKIDKTSETSASDIKKLKKMLSELTELYNSQNIPDEDKKTKLIELIARTELDLRFNYQNTILGNALQSIFDYNVNEILGGDLSLQQKEKLLSSAKEYYDKLVRMGIKPNVQIDFLKAQTQLSNAMINVIGSKLNQGIAVDYKTEIDEPFIAGVSNSVLKGLLDTNNNQSQELTQKLMGQMTLFNMQGGENPLYNPEFWRGYFECTGIIKQNETQVSEQQEIQSKETFAEYRARKIEEYKKLAERDDIEPGEKQITIIDKLGDFVKLNVDEEGKATGIIIDQNNKKKRFPIFYYTDRESVIKRKRSDGSFDIFKLREKALDHIFDDSVAAIFGCGIKKFRSNLLLHMDMLQDVILNKDIEEIGGRYLEYYKGRYRERNWVSFRMQNLIKEIRFPPGLVRIHSFSFDKCEALENVIIDPRCKNEDDYIKFALRKMKRHRDEQKQIDKAERTKKETIEESPLGEKEQNTNTENPKILAHQIRKEHKELERLRRLLREQQKAQDKGGKNEK